MASSRREFLKRTAGTAALVAGAGVGAGALAGPASAVLFNPKELKYLEIDGVNVGRLAGASGGESRFDVVIADYDADGNPDKLIGGLSHGTEFTLEVGARMSKAVYDWISASMDDPTVRKNGAIIAANYDFKELTR